MLFDTHAHLADAQFDVDRSAALGRAWEVGLSWMVEIGEEEAQWPKAQALAEAHWGKIYWTAGLHPYYAQTVDDALVERLCAAAQHPSCVGVGEIGLDYHRPDSSSGVQKAALEKLLTAAQTLKKPVVLHCREVDKVSQAAQMDLLSLLEKFYGGPRDRQAPCPGVAHCFQGDASVAWKLIEWGFMIGVDAPITYPNASSLRALITHIPLEHLVLETDSPYLPPQPHRGQRNEPAYLPQVCRALAELKHISVEKIAAATTANARKLYRLPAV